MKTLDQLKAEHTAKEAELRREIEIAEKVTPTPNSVQLTTFGAHWLGYRASLADALEMFRSTRVVPFYRYKGTFTRHMPAESAREKDGEQVSGPFAAMLKVDQGEGFGPCAMLCYFTRAGDELCLARIHLSGMGYIDSAPRLGASPRETRDHRGRVVERSYWANPLLNGLFDENTSFATGDIGPVKTGANYVYCLCTDQEAEGLGKDNEHALGQLQNLLDAIA